MGLYFQTILSSSSGNCLMLWTETTRVLIDCGFSSQKKCIAALKEHAGDIAGIDAVLVTHNHGDHINYSALKVLEKFGPTVMVHQTSVKQLRKKHFNGQKFAELKVKTFDNEQFTVGDLTFEPIFLPHHHDQMNYGYSIRYNGSDREYRVVTAADFHDPINLRNHLPNADMIYIEANHDPEMLRENPNFNSAFHMPNCDTAQLLAATRQQTTRLPKTIMLGHLSERRNEPKLAIQSIQDTFSQMNMEMDYRLCVAPAKQASSIVEIAG